MLFVKKGQGYEKMVLQDPALPILPMLPMPFWSVKGEMKENARTIQNSLAFEIISYFLYSLKTYILYTAECGLLLLVS